MKNDPSHNRYRGFKYFIFAMLAFGAIGFAFLFFGQFQTNDRQADPNASASSTGINSTPSNENPMVKIGEMKDRVTDTMAKGREKVSTVASDLTEKAETMVKSTSDGLTDKAGQMVTSTKDTTTSQVKEMAGNASDLLSGDTAGSQSQMSDTPKVKEMADKASDLLSDDTSGSQSQMSDTPKAKEMADKASDVFSGDTAGAQSQISEQTSDMMTTGTAESDQMSGTDVVEAWAKDQTGSMDAAVSEQLSATQAPMITSAEGQKQGSDAMARKNPSPAAAKLCIGPPEKGKDLGTRYIVASCETISVISERTGVGMKELIDHNPQVQDPDLIYPNQELRMPPRG